MGMDVYGINPTTEAGNYYRNSVWGWHPLAEYLTSSFPELTTACTYWHSNDGDGLNAEDSLALAEAIEHNLASGAVKQYQEAYEAALAALPMEECTICHGSGIRTDEIGHRYGYDIPREPGALTGGCNGCGGVGQLKSWATNYPFEEEAVREFGEFLRGSGGFTIN